MADDQQRRRQNQQGESQQPQQYQQNPSQQQGQTQQNYQQGGQQQRQPQNQQQRRQPQNGQGEQQQPPEEVAEQEQVEEVEQQVQEAEEKIESEIERLDESGEQRHGDFIGEQTFIHVAQHVAYEHYGQQDPLSDNEKDYIDPVDIFFIVKPYMHNRFGEKFRKLVELKHGEGIPVLEKVLGPIASRLNSRLINYEYYYAIKGIERAREEGQISLKVSDRIKYNLFIKTPPVGPPLVFLRRGFVKKKREWAKKVADRFVGHGISEEEVEEKVQSQASGIAEVKALKREVISLRRDLKFYKKKVSRLQEDIQEAKENNNTKKMRMLRDDLRRYAQEAKETKERLDVEKQKYKELKQERG